MRYFICIAVLAVAAAAVANANPTSQTAAAVTQDAIESEVNSQLDEAASADLTRLRKSTYGGASSGGYGGAAAYGAASIPAPPCPKNYLFSCQPSLSPVPCAAPAAAYGSSGAAYGSAGAAYGSTGAYSAPVPSYAVPQLPQGYPTYGQGLNYINAAYY